MAGLFVTFEGIDRSGKTTQARMLCEALGDEALAVREPGGTEVGERLRELLKDPALVVAPETEALLFAAARAELVAQVIRPALERDKVVVSDRFLDSSLAYQGIARGLGVDDVEQINRFATGGLLPDLTILLSIDPARAAERAGQLDRFEDEGDSLQKAVFDAYRELAAADTARWLIVDGDRPSGEVHADVLQAVEDARSRVLHGPHPDLTWVRPPGAHVMRVSDVDGPVVAAAGRTPFESKRRVFVLERVDTMNDEVANRLLKTLEEPPSFVHLILLTDQLGRVLETVVSRCQLVRFDPLPAERIAAMLEEEGVEPACAGACGRLALGNASRARFLASEEGAALRADVERMVLDALGAESAEVSWHGLLDRAEERRERGEPGGGEGKRERLEQEPRGRERSALEREFDETAKRDGRRARTEVLELGLELAAITFRDLVAASSGAEAAILGTDRIAELAPAAEDRDPV